MRFTAADEALTERYYLTKPGGVKKENL